MKRALAIWIVCSVLSLAAFAVMVIEDRRLGVALPYAVPIALGSVAALAPALFALFELLRSRRPIVVRAEPVVDGRPVTRVEVDAPLFPPRRRARTQGLVLLDCSTFPRTERAA